MDTRIQEIAEILSSHRGAGNKITSAAIARKIGIYEDDTHAQTRALIKQAAEQFELPLAGDGKGYFMITSEEELNAYIANLNSRIAGIEERKQMIIRNFRKGKK